MMKVSQYISRIHRVGDPPSQSHKSQPSVAISEYHWFNGVLDGRKRLRRHKKRTSFSAPLVPFVALVLHAPWLLRERVQRSEVALSAPRAIRNPRSKRLGESTSRRHGITIFPHDTEATETTHDLIRRLSIAQRDCAISTRSPESVRVSA